MNCGYHETDFKWSKLYQWGRKYGQGYNSRLYIDGTYVFENPSYTYQDAIVPSIEVGPVNIQTGCDDDQSNVFFESSSEYNYDWLNPQNNMLWHTGSKSKPVKTEYDLCPKGWRVPTYDEINNLKKNSSSLTKNELGQDGYYFSGEDFAALMLVLTEVSEAQVATIGLHIVEETLPEPYILTVRATYQFMAYIVRAVTQCVVFWNSNK